MSKSNSNAATEKAKVSKTNATVEKAKVSKTRKKNVDASVGGGGAKEALLENNRNTPDRKTNTMQKTRETKVTEKAFT